MKGFYIREFKNLRSSFSLSIVVHAVFLIACAILLGQRAAQEPIRRTTWIELEPLQQDLLNPSRRDKNRPDQRIVQTDRGEKTDKAAPDAFLGERTQTVDRQTVSKDKQIQMGESKTTTAQVDTKQKATPAKELTTKTPVATPLSNFGVPMLPSAQQMDELVRLKNEGKNIDDRTVTGDRAPQDYIQGMKEGEHTALNTKEFVFFGYYQRIRERLDRAWVPILRQNLSVLYKRGRTLASEMDYSTKVLVVMNTVGEIVKVQIMTESGAKDLDDAAIKAFNRAGPFPNPPQGIVDAKGEIRIPWEFILRT